MRHEEKPRRSRRQKADAGTILVLVVCGVVLAMHLVSWVEYFVSPARKEILQRLEKANALKAEAAGDPEKLAELDHWRENLNQASTTAVVLRLRGLAIHAVLLLFLFFGHNWARIVLAMLFLAGGLCGGIAFAKTGGFINLGILGGEMGFLAIPLGLLGICVNLGLGAALLILKRISNQD